MAQVFVKTMWFISTTVSYSVRETGKAEAAIWEAMKVSEKFQQIVDYFLPQSICVYQAK